MTLVPFLFHNPPGIGNIADCPEHLILCQLFHRLGKSLIQRATFYIAVYGIQTLLINLFQRMIVRKFPLRSAFQIADLPASAVQLVPRCKAAAVFGVPCVDGQKPFATDTAFLRCVTDTQTLKQIRAEHICKSNKVHPLDQHRYIIAGTERRNILDRVIRCSHPGIALCNGELRWEIAAKQLGKPLLYLTAVIDWYSRCIVGWEVDDTLDTRMVVNALKKAFVVAKPQILNSDQGCQFTSQQYIDFVKENGIRQSMDGKSRWADNIMIERWFRSFKYEEAYLTQYNNIKEARTAIGRYIHTYNFERCHSALDYQTPAECYYPAMLLPYAA